MASLNGSTTMWIGPRRMTPLAASTCVARPGQRNKPGQTLLFLSRSPAFRAASHTFNSSSIAAAGTLASAIQKEWEEFLP